MFWNDFFVAGNHSVPDEDRVALVEDYARPGRMTAAFSLYSQWIENDMHDNQMYAKKKLNIPVLSIGGDHSRGKTLIAQVQAIAINPQSSIFSIRKLWAFGT